METKLFIHVGLMRTGTTFLQRRVFPKIKNINYNGKPRIENVQIKEGMVNLISREGLSAGPGRRRVIEPLKPKQRFIAADRLKAIFPDAKIIVGVRDKESWLQSFYRQQLKGGGWMSWEEFMNYCDGWLDFDKYINYLKKLFDDVYVYRFEDLKANPESVVKGICDFMGVEMPDCDLNPRNASYTDYQLKTMTGFNKLCRSLFGDYIARELHEGLRLAIDFVRRDRL
ncbi:MAG: sulfotransferase family protein [Elusimicrobiota bacterium]